MMRRFVRSTFLSGALALAAFSLHTFSVHGGDDARWTGSSADYERSMRVNQLGRGSVFKTQVKANWFAENSRFWYRNELPNNEREFILVDAEKGTRGPAFDHAKLAAGLQKAGLKNIAPEKLPIEALEIRGENLLLRVNGKYFECDLKTYAVRESGAAVAAAGSELKSDPRLRASRENGAETAMLFINKSQKDVELFWLDAESQRHSYGSVKPGAQHLQNTYAGHVWLAADGDGRTLGVYEASEAPGTVTLDGAPAKAVVEEPVARRERGISPDGKWHAAVRDQNVWLKDTASGESFALSTDGVAGDSYSELFWSPDSARLVAIKRKAGDERKIQIVESSPKDQLQPKTHTIAYAKPGDRVAIERPKLFDISERKEIPVADELFANPWDLSQFRWSPDSKRFTFLFNQRGHQVLRLCSIDAATGKVRAIVNEESRTFIDYSSKQFIRYEDASCEVIWSSERDGWNHLYLYDAESGALKNQITRGEWVVRGIERIDAAQRQIYFRASGIYADQDPYYIHYCRIHFDGTGLVKLTEGDGTHSIEYSPDKKYFIDTYSRVDLPPVNELRRSADGSKVCELERGDASALFSKKWLAPERFSAKGRDGKTDIFGVIVRPMEFDPARKYPVIENIYAGPHGSFVPKNWSTNSRMQEIAELGFIVVQIDGMGTSNRSKAFHDVCWKNLADGGFPDRILWMKAAAEKYPYMDVSRVGIYGGSAGGQNALGAMLFHPDFYKAAAADCGCHDNRMDKIWWNEQWMGWPIGKHYEEQSNVTNAHKLKGKLLLTVGEMDTNVDPASTMQVVNALVKANKDFEFVIIPGGGHGVGETPYANRRRKDFFVRSLLGVEPRR
jgi:dipeptidyl-peptidase 4